MKKIILYIFLFVLICFTLPIIFTGRHSNLQVAEDINEKESKIENVQNENKDEQLNYNYKEYSTVKLLHAKTGEIKEIPIDEYLYGVVSSEMPASFEKEALKAQAVVARTYTIYKIQNNSSKHENADICDDFNCCQAWISKDDRFARWEKDKAQEYWNKIVDAVDSTKGEIVTYGGKPINAFFHSNSGGKTESTLNVWGGTNYPYLQTVATAGEDAYSQYASEVTITKNEFITKIKEVHPDFFINFDETDCIKILEYTEGGRVKRVKIGNLEFSGVEIRTIFKLKSANFTINISEDNIKFEVIGYGHGVGMSQTGADSMAKHGSNYQDIIKHFYTGVEIEKL